MTSLPIASPSCYSPPAASRCKRRKENENTHHRRAGAALPCIAQRQSGSSKSIQEQNKFHAQQQREAQQP